MIQSALHPRVSLRFYLCVSLSLSVGLGGCQSTPATRSTITLQEPVSYKVPHGGLEALESWYTLLALPAEAADWTELFLELRLLRGGAVVKTIHIPAPLAAQGIKPGDNATIRMPLYFSEPRALAVDGVELSLEYSANGQRSREMLRWPVERYVLRNQYIFPLAGNALITNGFYNTGGHLSPSTKFAIDVVGVDERFAAVRTPGDPSYENMIGWGRPVVAAASGTVVFVERGLTDHPYGDFDESRFIAADGRQAPWGNAVVIDHGEGEFSASLHLKEGSVTVAVGDPVTQGQLIGALGNSGASFGPHLHFHLQDGPELLNHSGLPLQFKDVQLPLLRKGEWVSREE